MRPSNQMDFQGEKVIQEERCAWLPRACLSLFGEQSSLVNWVYYLTRCGVEIYCFDACDGLPVRSGHAVEVLASVCYPLTLRMIGSSQCINPASLRSDSAWTKK